MKLPSCLAFDMDTVLPCPDMAMPLSPPVAGATALLEHVTAPGFLCRRYLDTAVREERELGGICSEAFLVLFI